MQSTLVCVVVFVAATLWLVASHEFNLRTYQKLEGASGRFFGCFLSYANTRLQSSSEFALNVKYINSTAALGNVVRGEVDFAVIDDFSVLSSNRWDRELVFLPLFVSPQLIVCNVGKVQSLVLDFATLAGVFTGTISRWDDPQILKLNPGFKASPPSANITVIAYDSSVMRSGTRAICLMSGLQCNMSEPNAVLRFFQTHIPPGRLVWLLSNTPVAVLKLTPNSISLFPDAGARDLTGVTVVSLQNTHGFNATPSPIAFLDTAQDLLSLFGKSYGNMAQQLGTGARADVLDPILTVSRLGWPLVSVAGAVILKNAVRGCDSARNTSSFLIFVAGIMDCMPCSSTARGPASVADREDVLNLLSGLTCESESGPLLIDHPNSADLLDIHVVGPAVFEPYMSLVLADYSMYSHQQAQPDKLPVVAAEYFTVDLLNKNKTHVMAHRKPVPSPAHTSLYVFQDEAPADSYPSHTVALPFLRVRVLLLVNLGLGNTPISLDLQTLANIYSGSVTTWDSPAIASLNPSLSSSLPNTSITLALCQGGAAMALASALLPFSRRFEAVSRTGIWEDGTWTDHMPSILRTPSQEASCAVAASMRGVLAACLPLPRLTPLQSSLSEVALPGQGACAEALADSRALCEGDPLTYQIRLMVSTEYNGDAACEMAQQTDQFVRWLLAERPRLAAYWRTAARPADAEGVLAGVRCNGRLLSASSSEDTDTAAIVWITVTGLTVFGLCAAAVTWRLREARAREQGLLHDMLAAQDTMQTKADFLSAMSQEIRTPLNGVLGMISLLQNTQLDAEQTRITDDLSVSAKHLHAIIDDILSLQKIEYRGINFKHTATDVSQCVEESLELCVNPSKTIELVYAVSEDVPALIMIDSTRLRQILVNLIGNAVKFTDHGEVAVLVDIDKSKRRKQRPPATDTVTRKRQKQGSAKAGQGSAGSSKSDGSDTSSLGSLKRENGGASNQGSVSQGTLEMTPIVQPVSVHSRSPSPLFSVPDGGRSPSPSGSAHIFTPVSPDSVFHRSASAHLIPGHVGAGDAASASLSASPGAPVVVDLPGTCARETLSPRHVCVERERGSSRDKDSERERERERERDRMSSVRSTKASKRSKSGSKEASINSVNTRNSANPSASSEATPTIGIRFRVRDSGIGIPKDKHHLIFNAFSQVDSSSTKKYEGTGLGLVICKRLVEGMGGCIGFDSVFGQGTTFTFVIPVTVPPPQDTDATPRVPHPPHTAFVVDDSALSLGSIKRTLTRKNYRVLAFGKACDAVACAARDASPRPDIALIDAVMPELSGVQLAAKLREIPAFQCVPFVLMLPCYETDLNNTDGTISPRNAPAGPALPGSGRRAKGPGQPRGSEALALSSAECAQFQAELKKPLRLTNVCDFLESVIAQGVETRRRSAREKGEKGEKGDARAVQPARAGAHQQHARVISKLDRSILKLRVLVVEDNMVSQKFLVKALMNLGFAQDHVGVAENGLVAVELVRNQNCSERVRSSSSGPFKIIFMDLHMPLCDGLEATKRILAMCESCKRRRPVIIGLTADAWDTVRDSCLGAGMLDFLPKPVGINDIVRILRKFEPIIHEESPSPGSPSATPSLTPTPAKPGPSPSPRTAGRAVLGSLTGSPGGSRLRVFEPPPACAARTWPLEIVDTTGGAATSEAGIPRSSFSASSAAKKVASVSRALIEATKKPGLSGTHDPLLHTLSETVSLIGAEPRNASDSTAPDSDASGRLPLAPSPGADAALLADRDRGTPTPVPTASCPASPSQHTRLSVTFRSTHDACTPE